MIFDKLFWLPAFVYLPAVCLAKRNWRDTGGTIILEEAWTIPELLFQQSNTTAAFNGTPAELAANLVDIHNQRLTQMDASHVDFMVLSCAAPCIQGFADPDEAAAMAVTVNNRLAAAIANNTERFGGFASLAMHNATVAAQELRRAVTELGFLGVLLNDYQQSGADGETPLYYDQPEYDVFWQTLTELDVPFYIHPRVDINPTLSFQYGHARFFIGPAQQFTATLSGHVLGMCVNGVFDRFPTAKLIVGHFGERIPSDLVRIDDQLLRQLTLGMPMQKNVTTYFHTNIFETSSGNFATDLLKFHIGQIGLDRIMYSLDYPFVNFPEGTTWVNTLPGVLGPVDFERFSRGLAIELLHLDD
ncbi:hypothetical protein D9619_009128 [Psilocybe cf. subviscida]|uniref:Amidohydrolase-related domain-containing protein n=1 Tax=Psilocybe cf. subviscida TaxID=2480587 RepID=A0A8H5BTU8_9AGAR|nr:hypothetical protein D9619_009128 [Psilocybe cf. subviscida]